ncbi:uncharacterized protein LOC107981174 [Nasonia vitripennis]|uniref:Reverse transcriptase domain-containing protein n=1 Tax=Nasonia vitripennis TaxID=7425 RepID=A0A7M7R3Y1_NASVI|nr:uncharacterized protein LOC107981174 [Nasonia vitripennis]
MSVQKISKYKASFLVQQRFADKIKASIDNPQTKIFFDENNPFLDRRELFELQYVDNSHNSNIEFLNSTEIDDREVPLGPVGHGKLAGGMCGAPLLISGDFNAQHNMWGSEIENGLGRTLRSALESSPHFYILNDKLATRIHSKTSCPDISLTSPDLYTCINLKMGEDSMGSDHFPICHTIEAGEIFLSQDLFRMSLTRIDWEAFADEVDVRTPAIESVNDINCLERPNNYIWWDKSCSALVDERREALSKFKSDPSPENIANYYKISRSSSRSLNKIKHMKFKSFLGSLNPSNTMIKNFQFIKRYKKRFYNENSKSSNSFTVNNNELLELAFKKIASSFTYQNLDVPENYDFSPDEVLNKPIQLAEMEWAIQKAKNALLQVQTQSRNNKGFRPIALANCLLKILERVINDRMQWFTENKNILPNSFYGFRRNRSCHDCLSILDLDIRISKLRNLKLGVLSLDLEGAYDMVNLERLLAILMEIKIPSKLLRFVKNLIDNRELNAFYNGTKFNQGSTNKGLPQGAILSPLLFNIYIRALINMVSHNIKTLDWLDSLSLRISIPKCSFIIFNDPSIAPGKFSIACDNAEIKNSDKWKYLGVLWDQHLSWEPHIDKLNESVNKGVAMLSSLGNFSWGVHPKTMILYYKSITGPKPLPGTVERVFFSAPPRGSIFKILKFMRSSDSVYREDIWSGEDHPEERSYTRFDSGGPFPILAV